MNQTLEGYTLRFWKNIFRPKHMSLYLVYRYPATLARHFSFANTAPGARFSKLTVITGPVKLFCFPFQMGLEFQNF